MSLRELVTQRELLANFILRELRTRYRRSTLGWAWSLANPIMFTLVYTIVFAVFLEVTPTPGDPSGLDMFAFFVVAGIVPWNFFANGLLYSMESVQGSGGLVTKVYFPREFLVIAPVISLVVNLAVELAVLAVGQAVFGYSVLSMLPWIVAIMALQVIFTTGFALFVSALAVRYRDIGYLVGVLLMLWFFMTPIVYEADLIPSEYTILGIDIPVRTILLNNPMARFVLAYRDCFYDIAAPGWKTMLSLLVSSIASFMIGYAVFRRRAPYFAEEL